MTDQSLRIVRPNGKSVDIAVFHSEGWSVIYVDGKPEQYGDTYLIWEWLTAATGINEESIEPTELLFPDGRDPGTLGEFRERQREFKARQRRAEKLEEEAARLRAEAAALRNGVLP
jgi:hypothetical protein